jgi:hypothetical protein
MATETDVETSGLIDAIARILRELINTPKFKEAVILLLNSIDPPAARKLVRVLFWEDAGLFLSIVGAVPSMVNAGSELVAEVGAQLNSMPPLLLQDFINQVVEGIDGAAAGEAAGRLVSMVLSLQAEGSRLPQGLGSLGEEFSLAYREAAGEAPLIGRLENWMESVAARARDKESTTYAVIQEASKALKGNPDFVEYVLKPLISPALNAPSKTAIKKERG